MSAQKHQSSIDENEASGPNWHALRVLAAGQAFFFTAAQAAEAGFSNQLLSMHTTKGRFLRPLRGIYRFADFTQTERPLTPVERAQDDLVVAWLWSGSRGVVSHESALLLHDLSDALPARIHLSLPTEASSRRREVPPSIILHFADLTTSEWAWMGPIPVTSPARSVLDVAAAHGDAGLVKQAIDQGIRRGLFRVWDVVPAVDYAQSFNTPGLRMFPEAVAELGNSWSMRAFSGLCMKPPHSDWPTLTGEIAERHGGRVYHRMHHPDTRTMSIHVAWPLPGPDELTERAVRSAFAEAFGWR